MKLKLDAEGHVVLNDGKPVYVHDDGKEVAFDAPATVQTISRLNFEAKSHRERADSAETKLKGFDGISDPAAARKALETIANLDHKKLVDAGEVEKVKSEISKAFEEKLSAEKARANTLEGQLYAEKIGGSFARSKFAAEKLAIPPDLVQARFGQNFKVEDGKVVAYDATGNRVFSRARPGEPADFEEALEELVSQYPYKDTILKGTGAKGDGARASNGTGQNGVKSISRSEFEKLDAGSRVAKMKEGFAVVDG